MDIPPFTHADANGENKSFFDYNEDFADSLRAAIKADHVRTNTPKELILFKVIKNKIPVIQNNFPNPYLLGHCYPASGGQQPG